MNRAVEDDMNSGEARGFGTSISDKIRNSGGNRRVFYAAFLAALAIFLAIAESLVPKPLPWMRIGLANAITLYAFTVLEPREVLLVVLARIIASSLMLGTLFSITFLLSLSGGVVSFLVMWLFYALRGRWLGIVGISILGAVASNAAQLAVVNGLFVNSRLSYALLPFLFVFALAGGTVSGLAACFLVDNI